MTANLADQYIALKAQLDEIEAAVKAVKAKIEATGQDLVTGTFADIKVSLQERTSFDKAVLEQLLSPDQLAAATKTSVFSVLRIGKVKVLNA